jgi:hypothetical protein
MGHLMYQALIASFFTLIISISSLAVAQTSKITSSSLSEPKSISSVKNNDESLLIERKLSEKIKRDVQLALKWFKHYQGRIDGSFGKMSQQAVGLWQQQNKFAVTNSLSRRQRELLLKNYAMDSVEFGLKEFSEEKAGIRIILPSELLKFEKYEFPFAYYSNAKDSDLKIILISQPGTEKALKALYDVLQTLAIVPADGVKEISQSSFTIDTQDLENKAYAYASLKGGYIKGFLAYYPPESQAVLGAIIQIAKDSITSVSDPLLKEAPSEAEISRTFFYGLKIKTPKLSRTGFFINEGGTVITSSNISEDCSKITLDKKFEVNLVGSENGVSVLEPKEPIIPMNFLTFSKNTIGLNSRVSSAGYSYEGELPEPSITYGSVENTKGLKGEGNIIILSLNLLPGDYGSAIVNERGEIIGMAIDNQDEFKTLSNNSSLALKSETILKILRKHKKLSHINSNFEKLTDKKLSTKIRESTILVSCWP